MTISCQTDGRPPQPVRPWKSGRVHLADGSKVVVLELLYSTEFGRESRKLASVTIGVPIVAGLPRLYQQCTNGVPIVKNSQKTVKTAKITTGVPIVTCLPRLYQQCNNSLPIVNKNLAIAKDRASAAHIIRRGP